MSEKLRKRITCAEVRQIAEATNGNIVEIIGKSTVIVTGANSGMGKKTAQHLAYTGATVILASRNVEKVQNAIKDIRKLKECEGFGMKGEDLKLVAMELDLSSLKSVYDFSKNLIKMIEAEEIPKLKLVCCNAGRFPVKNAKSIDGFELTFATNHLGHFFLLKQLIASKDTIMIDDDLRVVVVSSEAQDYTGLTKKVTDEKEVLHRIVGIKQDGMPPLKGFSMMRTYASSKLCNVYFAQSLNELDFVTAASIHPGVVKTDVAKEGGIVLRTIFAILFAAPFAKTLDAGTSTAFTACLIPDEYVGGRYLSDCRPVNKESRLAQGDIGKQARELLWKISDELCENFIAKLENANESTSI